MIDFNHDLTFCVKNTYLELPYKIALPPPPESILTGAEKLQGYV